jgi:LPXTG-motif cell wall-anchored protein
MKAMRTLGILFGFAMALSALVQTARADEWDKKTIVTFSDSVQLPGTVLQPGTYVFKLADSNSNRNIVQVFDGDEMKLITTVMAIPNYRLDPAGATILRYQERPADQPPAIEAWFYPGDNFGQQFVYPKSESEQLSQVNDTQVPSAGSDQATTPEAATPAPDASQSTDTAPSTPQAAPAQAPQSSPAQADPAPTGAVAAPATQSEPTTSTTQGPAQTTDTDATLPKTASSMPLVGLVGLSLLGTAIVLRRKARA